MRIFEHGILAESDEWQGALRLIGRTDLPVHSGFTFALADHLEKSLNERAVQVGRCNQSHCTADYYEESDLRYCVHASLYHLDSMTQMYVTHTQRFQKAAKGVSGNTSDPRVHYELDAFLGTSRRVYEAIRVVLWKHYSSTSGGRWRSIESGLERRCRLSSELQGFAPASTGRVTGSD